MHRRLGCAMLVAGALAVGCKHSGAAGSDAGTALPSGAALASAPLLHAPPPPPVAPAPGLNAPASFADLAAKADSSVVFVRTVQEQRGRTGQRRVVQQGLGTGFVYDPSGLILTNNHVVENATEVAVTIGKQPEQKATIVGRDPLVDVAVLRVEGKSNLACLPLGDSDRTRVGDWVVAIGNPFGLSHTVSAGIVSAKGRTRESVRGLGEKSGYYNFIQTDASINPGNSGGPLIDLAGRVIGINTAIRANANSIGFAIPINMVKDLLPMLIKDGKVERSAIGIVVSSVLPEDVGRLKLKDQTGALVRSVQPGGPADRAGLRPDDVVLGFQGHETPTPEKLRWLASLGGIGAPVTIRVERGGRQFDVKATLEKLPEQPADDPQDEQDPFGFP